jgi:hypothetical protein
MQTLTASYQGLSFLISLNWDRILYFCTIVFALWFGAWVGEHI